MSYRKDKYSDIANRFKEFLTISNAGDNITDLALEYLNEAQKDLGVYRDWDDLTVRAELTLTDKVGVLPSNCAKLRQNGVYDDSDVDGKPENIYYQSPVFVYNGYYVTSTFLKATGYTHSITFYYSPTNTIYIKYIRTLEDFTGEGVEYSFFPSGLLLAKAQLKYLKDNGRVSGNDYQMVKDDFKNEMVDYQDATQNVNHDMRMVANDFFGRPITVGTYDLQNGDDDGIDNYTGYDNDVDRG